MLGLKNYSDWWLTVLGFFLDEIHLRKCFSVHLVSLHFHLHEAAGTPAVGTFVVIDFSIEAGISGIVGLDLVHSWL